MSTQTTNYGLIKPQLTDTPDITAMNVNWDTIDAKLKNLSDNETELADALAANKKYVDDAIDAAIGIAIGGNY